MLRERSNTTVSKDMPVTGEKMQKALSVQNVDTAGILKERGRLGSEDVPSEDVISDLDDH